MSYFKLFISLIFLSLLFNCDGDGLRDLDEILFYDPEVYDEIDDQSNKGNRLLLDSFENNFSGWINGNYGAQAPLGEWGVTDAYQRSGNNSAFVYTGSNQYGSSMIQRIIYSNGRDLNISFYYQIHCDGGNDSPEFIFSVGPSINPSSHKVIFVGNKVTDQSKNIWTQVSKLFDNSTFDYDLVYIAFQSYTRPGNCYYYLDDVEVNYVN